MFNNKSMHILVFFFAEGFSLFSVVTFPNAECTTNSVPARTGICVTAEECSSSGDVTAMADGNCASGFGVCCMRRLV